MMKIKIKIDVNKINKEKLYKGAKGTYLDAVLVPTQGNKYGDDYFIAQECGKDESGQYIKGPIIGNARLLGQKPLPTSDEESRSETPIPCGSGKSKVQVDKAKKELADEDVPF